MRPAIGQHGGSAGTACLAELAIGFIAIDLQDTVIITEELLRPHAASARHVAVNDRGWIDAARCPIISDHRSQVTGLRFAASPFAHLCCGLCTAQGPSLQTPL